MKYLVSAKQMKRIDRTSIDGYGIPSLVLMERAALSAVEEAEKLLVPGSSVLFACGTGNNGADGIAAARIMKIRGYESVIMIPDREKKGTEEYECQKAIAEKLEIPMITVGDPVPDGVSLIMDAIVGIGLTGPLHGLLAEMIDQLNDYQEAHPAVRTVAVDMPSGISSDTGKINGKALKADVTVTFGEEKTGQILYPGRSWCGKLVCAEIGFPEGARTETESYVRCLEPSDLKKIPDRDPDSNKGSFGKVLVVAGSPGMAGAAYLCAKAAYRTGAGLVKIMTPEENRIVLQEKLPEAILSVYSVSRAERSPEEFRSFLMDQISWADEIVLGPGLSKSSVAVLLVETILSNAYVPIILDADAINIVSENRELLKYFTDNIIITPHLKEMSRLTDFSVEEIKADILKTAADFTEQYGVTVILKDSATVVSGKDGALYINESGSAALAKGGSGDVLSGIVAGLMSLGMEDTEAASTGVYLHGLLGEKAAMDKGVHSVLSGELTDYIGEVL